MLIKLYLQRLGSGKLPGFISAVLILTALYMINLRNYLLFHTLVELFIITVAVSTFMLAWNARRFFSNNYLMFLSIGFLFNAILELLHTLTYKGMNIIPNITTNEPTELWIAAGYVKSISFLLLPFITRKKLPYVIIFSGFIIVSALLIMSIFVWKTFPDCYVEGQGLTTFKVYSEFAIAVIFLLSMIFLLKIKNDFNPLVLKLILWSITMNICAEISFIFYLDVYGTSNMLGHLFLLTSYFLVYKAIIETGLRNPLHLLFHDLQLSQEEIREHAGKLEKINITLQEEIAERKAAELEVTRFAAELQELNKQKDKLFSIISHDLRNPFVGLLSLSKALAEKPHELSKKQIQEYSALLYSSAKVLYGFINSLLKWANIQTGKLSYKPVKINLCSTVSEIINLLRGNFVTKQIEIHNKLKDDVNIFMDENFINTILENLLSNAIKFTNKGGRIEIDSEKKNGFIEVRIFDNGIGIHPDDLQKLFKIDQGFSTTGTNNEEGAGLGLILCKEMVEKGSGKIWAESKEGEWSCFYFTVQSADLD